LNNFNDLTGVFDKEVSVFSNATTTTAPQHITIKDLLSDIRGGKYAERINRARELKKINEVQYKAYKKKLPAFTLSANCNHRKSGNDVNKLIYHTGLLQIDIDGISEDYFPKIKNQIQSDKHTVFCFVSPGGDGLKAGIMIDGDHHRESFDQAERYYKETYGIEIDKSTKDLYRPFFVSYDPELFINPQAETFKIQVQEPPTENQDSANLQKPKKKVLSKTTTTDRLTKYAEQSIENVKKILNGSTDGTRHAARLKAGELLGGYIAGGFYDEQTALNAIESTVKNNTTLSIESAMKDVKDGIEHGKLKPITPEQKESERETYLSQNGRTQQDTAGSTQQENVNRETGEIFDDGIKFKFWYETEKVVRGEIKYSLNIEAVKIYEYLKSIGVKRLRLNDDPMEPVLLVRIVKNIVTEIKFSELRTFIDRYIKSLPFWITANHSKDDLREMLTKQARTCLTQEGLELNVDYEKVKFLKDKQDRGFVFYRNGFVEVTADSMILKPYSELSGLIWKSQILDRKFTREDDYSKIWNSNYCRWTRNICSLRLPNVDFEEPRWNALRCTIGYMLHNYIDQADVFAVILSESFLGDKPNGRTGKGLLVKALSKIRKRSYVPGKAVDFSRSFTLQTYQPNSDIFAFEDVLNNFDFERLFNLLTEGFSYELKGERAVNLPLSESPKIIITTNFAVQGTSGSFKARKYEMELLPYYNDDYTPVTEFGAKFFESWDAEQWNIFDNFMLNCMQEFFKNKNKIPLYESDTVNEKKLIHGTSADFVEFADGLKRNEYLSIGATYDNFIEETGENTNRFKKQNLSEWITLYCEIRKLKLKKPFPQHKINDKNQKCYYIES
jgi:hypothetical protein